LSQNQNALGCAPLSPTLFPLKNMTKTSLEISLMGPPNSCLQHINLHCHSRISESGPREL